MKYGLSEKDIRLLVKDFESLDDIESIYMEINIHKIKSIFAEYPEIKLGYLFGSQASGEAGPLSDYDFAVYLNENNKVKCSHIQFSLISKLSRLFKTDKIDVVLLNLTPNPDLKYNIIFYGKLIYELGNYRMLVEPQILNIYFDFNMQLENHGLSQKI